MSEGGEGGIRILHEGAIREADLQESAVQQDGQAGRGWRGEWVHEAASHPRGGRRGDAVREFFFVFILIL